MTSFLGKSYKYEKCENLREFLEHFGAPADKVDLLLQSKPTQKLEKNGSDYVLTTSDAKTTELKFKEGVEFDETVTEGLVAKTTFTVGADVVTQVQKFADGRVVTLKRVYGNNQLVVDITASSWDGTARRFYNAV